MFSSNRTFGVEIECMLPHALMSTQFKMGSAHRGIPVEGSPLTATGKPWTSESDASLSSSWGTHSPVEVVSPALTGEAGLIDLLSMVDYMGEVDIKVNSTCGIHLHVGCKDFTVQQRHMFVQAFKQFELAFYGLNGHSTGSRYNGSPSSYCAPSPRWLTHDPEHIALGNYPQERYQSLNWQKFNKYGTFEFRLYSGQLVHEPACLITAVILGTMLADAVKADKPLPVQTFTTATEQMLSLMEYVGFDDLGKDAQELVAPVMESVKVSEIVF